MDPTKMTQDEFLCAKNLTREPAPNADATSAKLMGATILEESKIKSFGLYLVLRTCGDFRIIRLNDTDTGLIDRNSDLVGYYIDEGLRIDCGPARRQDLSVPLILAALPNRAPPTRRKVSAWRMERKSVNGGTRRQASREGPVLVVKLRARTKDDGTVRSLRWLLKRLLRDHRLVCVSVSEERAT